MVTVAVAVRDNLGLDSLTSSKETADRWPSEIAIFSRSKVIPIQDSSIPTPRRSPTATAGLNNRPAANHADRNRTSEAVSRRLHEFDTLANL
jgi:hypothetical protein